VGQEVGRFQLTRFIARGGMGQVWEARDTDLGRRVALKLVLPGRVDARVLDRFSREARAGGRAAHPNLVTTYDHGEDAGLAWIAQELIEGSRTLKDELDEARAADDLPRGYYSRVAELVAGIAEGLQAAHDAGVVHRDVKPQNVLLAPDGTPRVADFGLARVVGDSFTSHSGEIMGTWSYMSPEQVAASRSRVDHRSDVFSLGVVLYELLTLRRPFEGDTAQQIASKILHAEPVEPGRLRSRCPRDLSVICGKALEKRSVDRYPTMRELAADLRRFLADRPISARPPGPGARVLKWARRNPVKAVAGSITSVAFVVITGLVVHLADTNRALEIKTVEAQGLAASAEQSAQQARRSQLEAERRTGELLRLSVAQDLSDLVVAQRQLWPAGPDRVTELRRWVGDARALAAELPALIQKRDELRGLAVEPSHELLVEERESHPDYARSVTLRAELDAKRSALAVRRDAATVVLPELDWSAYPSEPTELSDLAWRRVRPGRKEFGREAEGYALAVRAAELAPDEQRFEILWCLAYAHHALGEDEAALDLGYELLEGAAETRSEEAAVRFERLEKFVRVARAPEALTRAAKEVEELAGELAELEEVVNERRTWRFPPGVERETRASWWLEQLTALIEGLEALTDEEVGLLSESGVSEEHGWSVPRRLRFAETLRDGFAPGGEFEQRWQEELPAIRTAYPELELPIQVGLLSLGPDPDSGLWEFWDIQTGAEPTRDDSGRIRFEEETGLVFVLLRGGTYWMGAQSTDPGSPNYDRQAEKSEGPVHEVELSPFFISKYEMSQAQWIRLRRRNPSFYGASTIEGEYHFDLTHPVEQVSWEECVAVLSDAGLSLPSEAQWEYGARGGTQTPWWSGADRETLRSLRVANLADQGARRAGANWEQVDDWPELDDGFGGHGPVDHFAPNPFGLHAVHGNVWEWCLDGNDFRFYSDPPVKDPVCDPLGPVARARRGGGFADASIHSRSANRGFSSPDYKTGTVGVRPARKIEP